MALGRGALSRAAFACVLLLAAGCRDAADIFVPADRTPAAPSGSVRRVTFAVHDDRSPSWGLSSDTIYYSGYSADHAPGAPARILAVALDGGPARLALRNVQGSADGARWLLAPALSPDGERVAFLDLEPLRQHNPCNEPFVMACPRLEDGESIPLAGGTVRVRALDETGPLADDPALPFVYGDQQVDPVSIDGLPTFATRYHPYQAAYLTEHELPSRSSWSPDGTRLATGDGLRIVVWDLATGTADTLPGSLDGSSPAWSPDGTRIAYTRTARVDSVQVTCLLGEYVATLDGPVPVPSCFERRWLYTTDTPRIVVVDVDGGDEQVVAEGREPAWAPDGTLWFASAEEFAPLRRIDLDSGEITELPGTAGGREPAVSPDGRLIAFSRGVLRKAPRDIFVAEVP